MGLWSDIAGAVVGVGAGLLTGNPGVGIAAGSAVANGLGSSSAAKTASQQQVGAAQQAASLQTPYEHLGTAAAGQLGALLGLPVTPAAGGPMGTATLPANGMAPRSLAGLPPGASMHAPPATAGAPSGGGSICSSLGSLGQSVQMRAPDGSVQAVPSQLVAHYQQLGAQVVQ